MKRYMVFIGRDYYPSGGMEDFAADYDNLSEAIGKARDLEPFERDWSQVYDSIEHNLKAAFRTVKDGIEDNLDNLTPTPWVRDA
jgi:hypothetical protein